MPRIGARGREAEPPAKHTRTSQRTYRTGRSRAGTACEQTSLGRPAAGQLRERPRLGADRHEIERFVVLVITVAGQIGGDQSATPRCSYVGALRQSGVMLVREPAVHVDGSLSARLSSPQGKNLVKGELLQLSTHGFPLLHARVSGRLHFLQRRVRRFLILSSGLVHRVYPVQFTISTYIETAKERIALLRRLGVSCQGLSST